MSNSIYDYTIGGNVPANNLLYVKRQADDDFYTGLKHGEFCYVLNARQMGKSSLRVRIDEKLKAEDVICVNIDITEIGSLEITPAEWYAGIIDIIAKEANIKDFNLNQWWQQHHLLSPVQHLSKFIGEILLVQTTQPIVIFVDESDGIRRFGQDFFVLIRACYNQRADKPAYQRLTFGILGVASPGDLIADKTITPFNIGRGIELCGFTLAEAMPLAKGLAAKSSRPEALLAIVLEWTGGQPFLTQKLCQRISLCERPLVAGEEATWVENIVQTDFLDHWESQDEPMHLQPIRHRILHEGGQTTGRLLGIYQQILQHGAVLADDSREQLELRLSGLVVKQHNQLVVYNPIYAQVFNQEWVNTSLAKLRPYAEALVNWQNNPTDESWLLRGQALQEALTWAKDKSLGDEDHRFLSSSQLLEQKTIENALKTQIRANNIKLFFLIIALGLTGWIFWERNQAIQAEEQAIQAKNQARIAQQHAEQLEKERVLNLFDFHIKYSSLFARQKDYARAKEVLNETRELESEVPVMRHYARNSMAWFNGLMGGEPQHKYQSSNNAKWKTVAVSSDGTLLATAGEKNTIGLFNIAGSEIIPIRSTSLLMSIYIRSWTREELASDIEDIVFHPQGKWLAMAVSDRILILSMPTGKRLSAWQTTEKINALAVSPDGSILASGGNKTVTVWKVTEEELRKIDLEERKKEDEIKKKQMEFERKLEQLRWNPDEQKTKDENEKVLSQMENGLAKKLDKARKKRKTARIFGEFKDRVSSLVFNPTGTLLATASDNTVSLWEVKTGKKSQVLTGHTNKVQNVVFNHNGKLLATGSDDESIRLWDVQTGQALRTLLGHQDSVHGLSFTTEGNYLISGSFDRSLRLWDVDSGVTLRILQGHNAGVTDLAIHSKLLFSTSNDGTLQSWEVTLPNQQMVDLPTGATSSAIAPDGKSVAVGLENGAIHLYALPEVRLLWKQEKAHFSRIMRLVFSADSKWLVSTSFDATKLWQVKNSVESPSPKLPQIHMEAMKQVTQVEETPIATNQSDCVVDELSWFKEALVQSNVDEEAPIHLDVEQLSLSQLIKIIGDGLGIRMEVDPAIQNKVTLKTSKDNHLKKQDLLVLFQLLLNDIGVSMEKTDGIYYLKRNNSHTAMSGCIPSQFKLPPDSFPVQQYSDDVDTPFFQMDFEQVSLRRLIETMGDILKMNFLIDPGINYRVSIRTNRYKPFSREDLWYLLLSISEEAGVSVEKKGAIYYFKQQKNKNRVRSVLSEYVNQLDDTPSWLTSENDTVLYNFEQVPLRYLIEMISEAIQINWFTGPLLHGIVTLLIAKDKTLVKHDLWPLLRLLLNNAGASVASVASINKETGFYQIRTNGDNNNVYAVSFSPDGKTLAVGSYDGQITLLSVETNHGRSFQAHAGNISSVAFDASGTRLLTNGTDDNEIRLWEVNIEPPKLLQRITHSTFPVSTSFNGWANLSPDGQWIATIGERTTVNIYNSQNGQLQYQLNGHENTVYRAIFSSNSQLIATVSSDATVKLWDLNNGNELFSLRLPTNTGFVDGNDFYPPLWDFDFRCNSENHCWIAVPLTRGKLVVYGLGGMNKVR